MKLLHKLTAALLCAACLCSLLVFPAGAASTVSTFSDITDPQVGQAVEVLRTMGVIDGVGGASYNPSGTLTRAEFCKLIILTMGKGDEVGSYTTKTIFPDVASRHWARGYVNLAASTELEGSRMIMGVGNGTFAPDRPITYGEAVTILLRVLGYGDAANTNWPLGAVNTAATLGLNASLGSVTPSGPISRAQAALLFYNMLLTRTRGGSIYASSLGSLESNTLLLSCNTTAEDGSAGAVQTLAGRYRVAAKQPAAFFQGKRGSAVFNSDGLFLTFLPDKGVTSKTFLTSGATATTLVDSAGNKYTVPSSATVWYDGERLTYGEMFPGLNRTGLTVTIFYTPAGAVDYVYVGGLGSGVNGSVMVALPPISGNPFANITAGATGYTILKNGAPATLADVRAYDVGTFDPSSNTLYLCDFRLSGVYQNALPNPYAPTSITLSGQQFQVLESAAGDFGDLRLGSTITLLFSADGKVAGAVGNAQAQSNAKGLVTSVDGSEATVELINAPAGLPATLKGTVTGSITNLEGRLVSVAGGAQSTLYLSQLTSAATAALDLKERKVGGLGLADNVRVFERVGNSALTPISLADVALATVPAGKVVHVGVNYANRVDLLVLDDVTGDRYTYGLATTRQEATDYFDGQPVHNNVTTITNGTGSVEVVGGLTFTSGFGGVIPSLSTVGQSDFHSAAGSVALTAVNKATLGNFNLQTNRFFSGSLDLPIADNVQCYNARTKTWFPSLRQCLAYSNDLTVYYDRAPELGGKVRVVVAN